MAGTDEAVVDDFKALIRMRTVSFEGPKGSYREAADFLAAKCRAIGLEVQVQEFVEGKPVVWATWAGSDASRSSLLLNAHYDVVPAMEEAWTVPPFEAVEREGRIYGRGTQDMKCVCVQYLHAIARLRQRGYVPGRTVHLSFLPDEEVGGGDGAGRLVTSDLFRGANVGCSLDEGLASTGQEYTVFYGERAVWWLRVVAKGPTGHASRFIADPAPQRLLRVVQRFLDFRAEQEQLLDGHAGCKHASAHKLGDVATLNLTMLRAGVTGDGGATFALNVIPTEAEAGFDMRIPPSLPLEEMEAKVQEWTRDEGVSYEFVTRTPTHGVSSIDEATSLWWRAFRRGLGQAGTEATPEVFPAATDSRYLRALGVPAYGFSPMNHSPILLHEHDEWLGRDVLLRGVAVYEALIPAMADAEAP